MYTYSFEKLEVWQLSRKLVGETYKAPSGFPNSEQFGLINQLRRASISVASNLAEGTSRKTPKDKAYFTQIAYSSLMEVLNQLIIASDLEYLSIADLRQYGTRIDELANKINALRISQLKGW